MTVSQITLTAAGPRFSRIVAGMMRLPEWKLRRAELCRWLNSCVDMGITTFDLADIYGDYTSEQLFGDGLAEDPTLRDKIQIVTKCGIKLLSRNRPEHTIKHYDTSHSHIVTSVENALAMLGTDYIDLLLIHRPDPLMDADETAVALTQLKQAGKVLHVGVSNFMPMQFELLASRLDFPLVTNQVEFSVIQMGALFDGTLDLCQRLRIAPMAWSPLGGGVLFHGDVPQAVRLRQTMLEIGETFVGASLAQVALAWILHHPTRILPVLGSGKLTHIREAVAAEALSLTREQWFAIWRASMGEDVP